MLFIYKLQFSLQILHYFISGAYKTVLLFFETFFPSLLIQITGIN